MDNKNPVIVTIASELKDQRYTDVFFLGRRTTKLWKIWWGLKGYRETSN